MSAILKVRNWQFISFSVIGLFYMLIYRRFLHPKSIMNSVLYHNALDLVNMNPMIQKTLGSKLTMMHCNGKIYPLLSNVSFDLVMFG